MIVWSATSYAGQKPYRISIKNIPRLYPHLTCFPIPLRWIDRFGCGVEIAFDWSKSLARKIRKLSGLLTLSTVVKFQKSGSRNSRFRLDGVGRNAAARKGAVRIQIVDFAGPLNPFWHFWWFWHISSKLTLLDPDCYRRVSWPLVSLERTLNTSEKKIVRFRGLWHFLPKSQKSFEIGSGLLIGIQEACCDDLDPFKSVFEHFNHVWFDPENFRFFKFRHFRSVSGPA